jgi:hypothetical protein
MLKVPNCPHDIKAERRVSQRRAEDPVRGLTLVYSPLVVPVKGPVLASLLLGKQVVKSQSSFLLSVHIFTFLYVFCMQIK